MYVDELFWLLFGFRSRVVAARGNLESTGVPTSVPVRVALELLQAGHRYLDVRHISIPIAFLLLRFNFYT